MPADDEANADASTSFSTPGKSKSRNKPVSNLDGFDQDLLRRIIYNFHKTENERMTLKKLKAKWKKK